MGLEVGIILTAGCHINDGGKGAGRKVATMSQVLKYIPSQINFSS